MTSTRENKDPARDSGGLTLACPTNGDLRALELYAALEIAMAYQRCVPNESDRGASGNLDLSLASRCYSPRTRQITATLDLRALNGSLHGNAICRVDFKPISYGIIDLDTTLKIYVPGFVVDTAGNLEQW